MPRKVSPACCDRTAKPLITLVDGDLTAKPLITLVDRCHHWLHGVTEE
jgi:hypothetical protein